MNISFRLLTEQDLPMLYRWLNQEHMRDFYQRKPISEDEVRKKYLPRIKGQVPTFSHIALIDNRPIGKIQCYRCLDYPHFASQIGVSDGIALDFFIGEVEYLGQGLGKLLLRDYLESVAFEIFPKEQNFFICHDKNNSRAIATSKSCGFRFLREVIEDGIESELLCASR